jgi:hypothetical protein
MQSQIKYFLIAIIAAITTAAVTSDLTYAQTTTTSPVQARSGSVNIFNITVDCSNGTQQTKHLRNHGSPTNLSLNVTCNSGGGGGGGNGVPGPQGPPGVRGPPGKNGLNGTITIVTTNGTVISTGNNSSSSSGGSTSANSANGSSSMMSSSKNILSPPLIAH